MWKTYHYLSSAYLFETKGKRTSIILLILGKGRLCPEIVIRTDYKSILGFFSKIIFLPCGKQCIRMFWWETEILWLKSTKTLIYKYFSFTLWKLILG